MNELEKMVKERLTWDNRIDESQINVSIKDNVAILKGCVSTYPEKVLAEIETKMVPGIKTIINDIEVIFSDFDQMPSDQEVEEALFCLLDSNSELDFNDVKISINNGTILLEGTVNSYWKKEKIRKLASQVSGVKGVVNKISVVPDVEISDEDITDLIIRSMQNSVHVDAHKVDVKVKDGIVSLSGTLSSNFSCIIRDTSFILTAFTL